MCYQAWLLCNLAFPVLITKVCVTSMPSGPNITEPLCLNPRTHSATRWGAHHWWPDSGRKLSGCWRERLRGKTRKGRNPASLAGLAQELASLAGFPRLPPHPPVAVPSKSERKPSGPAWRGVGGEVAARSSSAGPGCRFVTSPVSQQARTACAPPTRLPVRPPPSGL